MKEQKYHIDVTPEEDSLFRDQSTEIKTPEKKKPAFGRVFWVVAGAHITAIGALLATCSAMSSKPTIDLTKHVNEIPQNLPKELTDIKSEYTEEKPLNASNTQQQAVSVPLINKTETKQTQTAIKSGPAIKLAPCPSPEKNIAKEYVVKKGDTIYSISKKFKLNTKKLLEINNIKDPNKIAVGQKLKFI